MRVSKRIKIALIISLTILTNTLLFIIKPDLFDWITASPNPVIIVAAEIIIHPFVWWIIIETALSIDQFFNRRIKWIEAPIKRLVIQTLVQIVTIIAIDIAISLFFQIVIDAIGFAEYCDYYRKGYITVIQNLIVDVTVSIMIIVMNTINYLIVSLRKSANDAAALKISTAEYRQAAAEAELKALQLQIDPHFEFIKYDGKTGLDILLQNTNKKLVDFEMDMYWVIKSGVKPEDLFKQNRGRFTMWHIKDEDKSNPNLNTEIGSGSLDYKAIFRAKKVSGMKYFFVEHENNFHPDHLGSIATSAAYVKANLL